MHLIYTERDKCFLTFSKNLSKHCHFIFLSIRCLESHMPSETKNDDKSDEQNLTCASSDGRDKKLSSFSKDPLSSTMTRRLKLFLTFTGMFISTYLLIVITYVVDLQPSLLAQSFSQSEYAMPGVGFRKLLGETDLTRAELKGVKQRLPQCIIIGVRKCGTRALLEFLDLHPYVAAADDEVHFFDNNANYKQGLEWYRTKMPFSTPQQVTIEKSPAYFITEDVPQRIYQMNSSIKLIAILRDPTTRVISDYTQVYINRMAKNKTFDKFENIAIDTATGKVNTRYKAIRISVYHHNLARWLEMFGLHQIHIVDGDRLITDPIPEIRRVESFLGLDHFITEENLYFNTSRGFYCMKNGTSERCLGSTKGRKHPHIDESVTQKLQDFFRPHNRRLFRMINQQLEWP